MTDQYVGEVRMFAGNFAPSGWALCNGQILPISQNTALFSLLGTNYGGNGTSTFGLPNLQARFPMHAGSGSGPGLSERVVGESGGEPTVTLLTKDLPLHNHALNAASTHTTGVASSGVTLAPTTPPIYHKPTDMVPMAATSVSATGGNEPHENRQPYLAVTFIIALQGIFPSRN